MRKHSASTQAVKTRQRKENTALGWLRHDIHGAGVLETARQHLQIQYAVAAILPTSLGSLCQVGKLDQQQLQLVVPSAAHAAKLRQLAPRIAQSLAEKGWNLSEISVRIQAGLPKPGARQTLPPKEAQPLGNVALDAFEALQRQLKPGPLADAVTRLLKHHQRG